MKTFISVTGAVRVTKIPDPVKTIGQNKTRLIEVNCAHNESKKLPGGEWANGPTTWITVKAWGPQADWLVDVEVGDLIIVQSAIQNTEEWGQEGAKKSKLVWDVKSFQIERKNGPKRQTSPRNQQPEVQGEPDKSDENLPF